MKIWKLTLRRSSGVNNTLRQSLSLQSFCSENLWENGTPLLKPGDHQRGSTTKKRRHPHPRCVSPSPHLHQFRHYLQQQAIPELHLDSRTLFAHLHEKFLFRGTWRLIEMAKIVLAEPTTDSVSAWDEVISSFRIALFWGIPWNSNNWLPVGGLTCLYH